MAWVSTICKMEQNKRDSWSGDKWLPSRSAALHCCWMWFHQTCHLDLEKKLMLSIWPHKIEIGETRRKDYPVLVCIMVCHPAQAFTNINRIICLFQPTNVTWRNLWTLILHCVDCSFSVQFLSKAYIWMLKSFMFQNCTNWLRNMLRYLVKLLTTGKISLNEQNITVKRECIS